MLPIIICVDDDEDFLSAIYRNLRNRFKDKYEIEAASSGSEAIELIESLKNDNAEVAMVISDYTMPYMNGGELLQKVRDTLPYAARILLTGQAELHDVSVAVNKCPLDKLLLKTDNIDDLYARISESLLSYTMTRNARSHQKKASERNVVLELVARVTKTGSFIWMPSDNTIEFSSQWRNTYEHEEYDNTLDWYLALIDPRDIDKVKEYYQILAESSASMRDIEFRIKDGRNNWRWVHNSARKMHQDDSDEFAIIIIEQDITEYKKTEELLIKANQIDTILKHVTEQIILTTCDGKVIWANRNEDGSPCTATDFICYEKWGHKSKCENCPVTEAIQTNESVYTEIKTDDGRFFAATAAPIFGDNGEMLGLVHSRLDITRQKQLEVQLRHNQKMESVGQLAAGIAHELNTPIQYISDNLNFLKRTFDIVQNNIDEIVHTIDAENGRPLDVRQLADDLHNLKDAYEIKEAPNAFADALYGTSHISRIVSAMKDFTHPDGCTPEITNLNQIINNAVTISKNEWKYVAQVETNFEDEILNITCLPGGLLQVIINMIVNASHAIEQRKTEQEHEGMIVIKTRQEGGNAIIELSDNGTGIPDKYINNIFDPFFTTKEVGKGTGQGLAITHDIIVNKHKGNIQLKTAHGQGTTFILTLPVSFSGSQSQPDYTSEHQIDI